MRPGPAPSRPMHPWRRGAIPQPTPTRLRTSGRCRDGPVRHGPGVRSLPDTATHPDPSGAHSPALGSGRGASKTYPRRRCRFGQFRNALPHAHPLFARRRHHHRQCRINFRMEHSLLRYGPDVLDSHAGADRPAGGTPDWTGGAAAAYRCRSARCRRHAAARRPQPPS